jgi:predicted CDP-diglyceride synthetase/phosphatidate cytidylyltransferase
LREFLSLAPMRRADFKALLSVYLATRSSTGRHGWAITTCSAPSFRLRIVVAPARLVLTDETQGFSLGGDYPVGLMTTVFGLSLALLALPQPAAAL